MIHLMRVLILLAIPMVVGCQKGKGSDEQGKSPAEPPPATKPAARPDPKIEPPPPSIEPKDIAWEPKKGPGVSFDAMTGAEVTGGDMNGIAYMRQEKPPVAISIWNGGDRTIDAWRRGLGKNTELTPEVSVDVCGRKGIRQEARLAGGRVQVGGGGASMAPDLLRDLTAPDADQPKAPEPPPLPPPPSPTQAEKRWRDIPPRTIVVLAFLGKNGPTIASWTVETAQRDAFKAAEDHFFASLRCE
jgi:hypothetical protein